MKNTEEPTLSEVFEKTGPETPFKDLEVGTIFMVPETQINKYWKSAHHDWQPYRSSIVYKKISATGIQRLMTDMPVPIDPVADESAPCSPVRFKG